MNKFPYYVMMERQDALERLDLCVTWGHYDIRVLRFHYISFPPGKVIDYHNHAEYEFHFIPRGKGKVILVDQEYALREGMFYLTGPGVMHYQEADKYEAMDELCLHVDIIDRRQENASEGRRTINYWEVVEAEECMDRLRKLPLIPTTDSYEAMPCFLEAYQACNDKIIGLHTSITQCVINILLRAVRAYENDSVKKDLPSRDMKMYRYELALQYMRANYSGTVTLEHVAEKLNISSRQLQRIFREVNPNESFSYMLEHIRLEHVCQRLIESTLSIEKIAIMEGFANGNYLHLVFRKRFGMTPSEYRAVNTNG